MAPLFQREIRSLGFESLISRLTVLLRSKLTGGEFTERQLGRLAGISQPHIHHLLNGVRALTPAKADLILCAAKIDLTDLIETSELKMSLEKRAPLGYSGREIPMLDGSIGPGNHWPLADSPVKTVTLSRDALHGLQRPTAASLAFDESMPSVMGAGDIVILDGRLETLENPDPRELYVVDWRGEARVRWIRQGARQIYLVDEATLDQPRQWEARDLHGRSVSEIAKARVLLLPTLHGPYSGAVLPRKRPGTSQVPVRRSAAS
jgi:hypothetical protein